MVAQFILKPKGTLNTTYVNFIFQIMFWFQGEAKTIYIKDTGILTWTGIKIPSEKDETGILVSSRSDYEKKV